MNESTPNSMGKNFSSRMIHLPVTFDFPSDGMMRSFLRVIGMIFRLRYAGFLHSGVTPAFTRIVIKMDFFYEKSKALDGKYRVV